MSNIDSCETKNCAQLLIWNPIKPFRSNYRSVGWVEESETQLLNSSCWVALGLDPTYYGWG